MRKYSVLLCGLLACQFLMGQSDTLNQTVDGKKEGYWIITASDAGKFNENPDAIFQEGSYKGGRKNGIWRSYYPNGNPKIDITYTNGRMKGPYTEYYKDGGTLESGQWVNGRNKGKLLRYWPNGAKRQEFTFNDRGKRDGVQTYFHANGEKELEGSFIGGKETGDFTRWYDDGSVKEEMTFNNGRMDSTSYKKFEPAVPVVDQLLNNPDVEEKISEVVEIKEISQGPKKVSLEVLNNGRKTIYRRDKQIWQSGEFKGGRLYDGKYYRYNDEGILKSIEQYKKGKYVGDLPMEN